MNWLALLWCLLWGVGTVAWGLLAWHVDNNLAPYRDDDMGRDARYLRGMLRSEAVLMGFIPILLVFMPLGLLLRCGQWVWLMRPDAVRERAQARLDELLMPNAEPTGVVAWTARERRALGLDDTDDWLARTDRLLS